MGDSRDEDVLKSKSVVAAGRLGLSCKTNGMQSSIEPVAAAVTRKHAAGSVGPMCRLSKTDDEKACILVSEVRHRPAPIFLVGKRGASLLCLRKAP